MNETEKENVKEAEEEEEGIWVREQRKRSRRRRRREEQLADRLNLAPASDRGQRQRQWQRAEVRGQTSVIFFFFFSLLACQSRVRAVSEKQKKKKRDTRRTPESGESYPYWCPTRVRHRHNAKNGVSMQPSSQSQPPTFPLDAKKGMHKLYSISFLSKSVIHYLMLKLPKQVFRKKVHIPTINILLMSNYNLLKKK